MTTLTRSCVALLAVAFFTTGCGETVDTSSLPDNSGYKDWYRIDVTGDVPGHFDTYRIIYVNDVARGYDHAGDYPIGSVIVKEIREKNGSDDGALKYIAVMRQLADGAVSVDLDEGWLFTDVGTDITGEETHVTGCWKNCHVQAPYRGAWFDYGVGAGAQ